MNNNNQNSQVTFEFPVGYETFHKNEVFNYQFNRWYSLGYAVYDDLMEIAKQIVDFNDWEIKLFELAEKAESENRIINAAYYLRAAEFYVPPNDEIKMKIYNKFKSLIHKVMIDDGVEILNVPYENAFLPCIRLKSQNKNSKGCVVMHGGFDSFKEEFYSFMKHFAVSGYDVVVFDGPGQGGARKEYNIIFDYRWEKPVKAVLDYFDLDDVTLLGVSMGGYMCFRAAAFEPRIKRVIASSVAYDYTDFPAKILQPIVSLFYNKLTNFTNKATWKEIEKGGMKSWYFSNLMYMLDEKEPIDAIHYLTTLTADKLHCDKVKQDVLILTGRDDHACPFKMHDKQIKALINANSITPHVFYKDSHASHHCQIGNMALNFKTMIDWIEKLT